MPVPVKMPNLLRIFILYSVLFCIYDLIRVLGWPIRLPYQIVGITGSCGSAPYAFALTVIGGFFLSHYLGNKFNMGHADFRRLPYAVLLPLAIYAIYGVYAYFTGRLNADLDNAYLSPSIWSLVSSLVIPGLWVSIWFSAPVRNYLRAKNQNSAKGSIS